MPYRSRVKWGNVALGWIITLIVVITFLVAFDIIDLPKDYLLLKNTITSLT